MTGGTSDGSRARKAVGRPAAGGPASDTGGSHRRPGPPRVRRATSLPAGLPPSAGLASSDMSPGESPSPGLPPAGASRGGPAEEDGPGPAPGALARAAPRGVVVKVGGSVAEGPDLEVLAGGVAALHAAGLRCVLVHGGGPLVTRVLERLGLESRFEAGLRVTDEEAVEAVEMALSARVNQSLVGALQRAGVPAVGLSGRDGGLLRAAPHPRAERLGRVGTVVSVDAAAVRTLAAGGFVPVVSPVSAGPGGEAWNVNADHAAGALAAALGVTALLVATDVPGLRGADGEVRRDLSAGEALDLVRRGVAAGGMGPKVEACVEALAGGVARAHLLPGGEAGILEAALAGRPRVGTVLRPDDAGVVPGYPGDAPAGLRAPAGRPYDATGGGRG